MTDEHNVNKLPCVPAETVPRKLLQFYTMADDSERQAMVRLAKQRLLDNVANHTYPNPKEM